MSHSGQMLLKCCFMSTETVGILGTGAQDNCLDFHSFWILTAVRWRWWCWLSYSTILHFWADSLCSSHTWILSEWLLRFFTAHSEYLLKYLQHCLVVTWLVPRRTAAVLAHIMCTLRNNAPCRITSGKNPVFRVHACLALTHHLHFWAECHDHSKNVLLP